MERNELLQINRGLTYHKKGTISCRIGPPVREAKMPKGDGKEHSLGIPTIIDRVAQDVIRQELEKIVEPTFHPGSFGYRPGKSPHGAVEQCIINCRERLYVVDIDIKGFFDHISHEQMMRILHKVTDKGDILYHCFLS